MTNKSEAITIVLANDKALGEIFEESELFPDTKSKSQAIVKIMAGREIGLQPIESMTGLNIFSGKISISGNVMASKIKGNPKYDYRASITDEAVSIDFFEILPDGTKDKLGNSTFTMQDAKNAKLAGKDNWIKWKRNMMFNRALSNGQKWYCPDVFGGSPVYTPDELDINVNEQDEPIDITPEPIVQPEIISSKPERKAEVEEFETEEPKPETYTDYNKTEHIIPDSIIDDIDKPREALERILEYAMRVEKGKDVKAIVIEHYKAWATGEPSLCNIPEINVIKIVEGLTGVKLKKKEKSHKCDCGKKITEAELEERDGFCMACWKGMETGE